MNSQGHIVVATRLDTNLRQPQLGANTAGSSPLDSVHSIINHDRLVANLSDITRENRTLDNHDFSGYMDTIDFLNSLGIRIEDNTISQVVERIVKYNIDNPYEGLVRKAQFDAFFAYASVVVNRYVDFSEEGISSNR